MSRLKGIVGFSAASSLAVPLLMSVPITGWAQIDEIVVTTRKREESLQDVPLAITALTAEQIQRQGIRDLDDVVKLTPSVQFDSSFGPSDTRVTIRGLSNTRGRSNVAFLVDGVDVTTENLVTAGSGLLANRRLLNDVERIEIVKGPQSALYGRAAFAGAISYVSKEPGTEVEARLSADVAEDDQYVVDFSYGGPVKGLEDVLGVRVSGVYWDEAGRFVNSVSGNEVGGSDGFGGALTAVWTPIDELKVKWRTEYTDENYQPRAVARVGGGLPFELRPTPDGSQDNTWQTEIVDGQRVSIDANGDGFPDLNPGNTYTCPQGSVFKLFPTTALDTPALANGAAGSTSLRLGDFGPGYCIPETFGDASSLTIAQSEDPWTGEDYAGTSQQTFRSSLNLSLDVDSGTLTSITGFTDFRSFDTYDQTYQAVGRPDTLLGMNGSRTTTETNQFSQEIRFASAFDGPVNFILGGFYWQEERQLNDQNWIAFCSPVSRRTSQLYDVPVTTPSASNAFDACNGLTPQEIMRATTVSAATNAANGLPPVDDPFIAGTLWNADTQHKSIYLSLDWQVTETVTLTFENRFVWEDFTLRRPSKTSCTNAAFSAGPTAQWTAPLDRNGQDLVCESERRLNPQLDLNFPESWSYIQGSQSSQFQTPKLTLEWAASDDALLYFFWATGQKPGGINQLTSGNDPVKIEDERFGAEKLTAWEIGGKTSWDFAGYMQINFAAFLQEYEDKQISTQIEVNDVLAPRVLNAGGAEVYGVELDVVWQPSLVEGLTLTGAYTWLDAEYTEFILRSGSLQRSAATGQCPVFVLDSGATTCQYDFAGNKLERTPENAFVFTGNFTRQFFGQDFDWFVETNGTFQDERFLDEDNFVKFDAYWLWDVRLGLQGEKWDTIFYVENLTDNDTLITGGSGPDFGEQVTYTGFTAGFGLSHYFGTIPRPRTVGLRATFRF